jgi:hypothetical protein
MLLGQAFPYANDNKFCVPVALFKVRMDPDGDQFTPAKTYHFVTRSVARLYSIG